MNKLKLKSLQGKKSYLLLIFLILSASLIRLAFGGGTAFTLMSFFTLITGIYVILKYLNSKHQNKTIRIIRILFRSFLLVAGILCVYILTLITIPQFSCQTIPKEVKEVDYLILLGAGLKDGDQLSYSLKTRLDKTLEVFAVNPNLKIIVSGGQGADELLTEAQAMKNYLTKNGVPENQIIMEDEARSTYENLVFSKTKLEQSKEMLQQQNIKNNSAGGVLRTGPASNSNDKVIILSSDFHMFRTNFISKRLDLNPIGVCSPVYPSLKAVYMIREIPAVINDYLGNILK